MYISLNIVEYKFKLIELIIEMLAMYIYDIKIIFWDGTNS